jgi:hypothetical protein
MNRKLILLLLLLMMTCKGLSMKLSISDSIAVIAPKGYVLLTTDGARHALAVKAEAEMLRAMNETKDNLLQGQADERAGILIERGKLKRKVFWQGAEIWSLRVLVVALIFVKI